MKEIKFLKILDRFGGLLEKLDIDYPVMRRILQTKLLMDGRRAPTIVGKSGRNQRDRHAKDGDPDRNQFFGSLWLYLIFGGFTCLFVLNGDNYIFQMSFVFGILMFMIMTSLISDFSSVLLDVRDRSILQTKPVNRRTIAMAKALHIFYYLFFLTGALAVIPLGVGLFRHGWGFFLIFAVELVLMDLLIIALTAMLYLLVLRLLDGERLKDLINYVQIGLTIGIALGYQLLIRVFDFIDLQAVIQFKWWHFLIPPIWFGAPYEMLLQGDYRTEIAVASGLALLVPVIAGVTYLLMMPSMEKNLQKLAGPGASQREGAGRWVNRLARVLCPEGQERAFFHFAWRMMAREREFKLKVYPNLGFSLIFPPILLFTMGMQDGWASLRGTQLHLFIYGCALLMPSLAWMLRYSSNYKASWIYRTAPVSSSVPIQRGTLTAAVVRLLLPVYALEAVGFMVLFGAEIIPDLLAAGLGLLAYAVICFAVVDNKSAYPFSERFEAAQTGLSLKMIGLMLMLAVFGLLHYIAAQFSFGVLIYIALLLAANWFLWLRGFGNPKLTG